LLIPTAQDEQAITRPSSPFLDGTIPSFHHFLCLFVLILLVHISGRAPSVLV
jgi:hypothetical protein